MARKRTDTKKTPAKRPGACTARAGRPSSLLDTRIIYCGDCLDRLARLPDGCVDRPYLWHRFPTGESDSNRNYEVFWDERSEPRAPASGFLTPFEARHASHPSEVGPLPPDRLPGIKATCPWATSTAATPTDRSGEPV